MSTTTYRNLLYGQWPGWLWSGNLLRVLEFFPVVLGGHRRRWSFAEFHSLYF